MSHYTVLAHLPADVEDVQAELEKRLAPFDENERVEPYRSFEDGAAEDFWFVSSVWRGATELAEGKEINFPDDFFADKVKADGRRYVSGYGHVTLAEYREAVTNERTKDAKSAAALGEHPTWEDVVRVYNAHYHPGVPAVTDAPLEGDDEGLHYDPETGRAYTWSTYNPQSKWDWWSIGGRWTGYFRMKGQAPGILTGRPGVFDNAPGDMGEGIRADGGPKGLIDIEAMRGDAAVKAHAEYDAWEKLSAQYPPAKSWEHFTGLVEVGELTIDQAREQYHAQPLIQASQEIEVLGGRWADDPVSRFLPTREEYVQAARNAAVPAYALLTLSGEWVAPGRMGWFGMSSDGPGEKAGYHVAVNKYLDEVPDNDLLVLLDLHI